LFVAINANAQTNNDCASARLISNTNNFCDIFSNDNATDSAITDNSCWTTDPIKDVWFRFTARRQGMLIRVFAGRDIDDGFGSARIQVFSAECDNLIELECFPLISNTNLDEFELYLNTLEIGEEYFIRVDSKSDNRGNFQLCLNSFNPLIQPFQDCADARTLCNTESFSVNFLSGGGDDNNELTDTCLDPRARGINAPSETGSIWYVFTCRNPGDLAFTLTSNRELNRDIDSNPEEDLDFVVYELPDGINGNGPNNCDNKQFLRCMASGITVGQSEEFNRPCLGQTGLRLGNSDFIEDAGCNGVQDNNFLAPIQMTTGTSYALVVNNFSQSNFGFTIDFDGTTGTFVGPEASFTTDMTELFCDQEITFTDQSIPGIDGPDALSYVWNFGEEAFPIERSNTQGPHTIEYESFGEKFISLQVTSGDGCVSVDILDLDVGTCCDPAFSTLSTETVPDTIDCPGDQTGVFQLIPNDEGHGGVLYSFDDGLNFSTQTSLSMLVTGDYNAIAQDKKGCRDPIELNIPERLGIEVDAGTDQTLGLGETTTLIAQVDPPTTNPFLKWSPEAFVDCVDCLTTVVRPVIPTEFIITAENEFGCQFSDIVLVDIDANFEEQVYAPNAITPNGDGANDYFKLFGSLAVSGIDALSVFNRWGDLIYSETDLPIEEDFTIGWDGSFRGQPLNPDVFSWIADVRFIDDTVIVFKGTVNLITNER